MHASRASAFVLIFSVATGSPGWLIAQESLNDIYSAPIIINYDPAVFPLNASIVAATLHSEQFYERLTPALEEVPSDMSLQFRSIGDEQRPGQLVGSIRIGARSVDADGDELKGDRFQFWHAVVEELEDVLSETAKRLGRQHEAQWDLQRALLQQKRDDLKDQLDKGLQAAASVRTIDSAERLEQLSSKKHEVSFQLAGTEARRQAIQRRMDELKSSGTTAELDREIIEHLEKVVAVQEHSLDRTRQAFERHQAVTEFGVKKAEGELAKAWIDLLRAKKEATAKSSPELAALSEELSRATIAATEQRAILQAIESRIEEVQQALDEQAARMHLAQEVERRAAILSEQLATIEKRLAAMELERLERTAAGRSVTIVPWSVPSEDD